MPKFYSAKQFCKHIHVKKQDVYRYYLFFFIFLLAIRILHLPQSFKFFLTFLKFLLFLQPFPASGITKGAPGHGGAWALPFSWFFPLPGSCSSVSGNRVQGRNPCIPDIRKNLRGEHRNMRYRGWGAAASLIRQNLSPFASIQAVPYPGYQNLIFYITNSCKNKVGKNEGFWHLGVLHRQIFNFVSKIRWRSPVVGK